MAAGGTLAYLTDKDSVTNQFVVGKSDIEGNEPSYAPDPEESQSYCADPGDSEGPAYQKIKVKMILNVYMDVSIPIAKSDRCRYIRKPFKRRSSRRYGTVLR